MLYCEAMTVLVGLEAVLSEGFQQVHMESDSQILINVLLHNYSVSCPLEMLFFRFTSTYRTVLTYIINLLRSIRNVLLNC